MNIDLMAEVIAWIVFVISGTSAAVLLAFLTHQFCLRWERRTSKRPAHERQSSGNDLNRDRHQNSTSTVSEKTDANRR